MVHKCNYCKEIKPCRKNKLYGDGAGVGYPCMYYATEWICKDCTDYAIYKHKEAEKKETERLKEFIKERNRKLKEIRSDVISEDSE